MASFLQTGSTFIRQSRRKILTTPTISLFLFLSLAIYLSLTPSSHLSSFTFSTSHAPQQPDGSIAMMVCWTGNVTEAGRQSVQSKREYAAYHGYQLHETVNEPMPEGKRGSWNKISSLVRLFKENPETEWFFFTDQDAMIMNPHLRLEDHILGRYNISTTKPYDNQSEDPILIVGVDCNGVNAGVFMIRNVPLSRILLDMLFDPLVDNLPYGEQDSLAHMLSHHQVFLNRTILVPLRLFNSYSPSSCPIAELGLTHYYSEWNTDLFSHVASTPGYEQGEDGSHGWPEGLPKNWSWKAFRDYVAIVNEQGELLETREMSSEEMLGYYKTRMEQQGMPYDPLLLRENGGPPMSPPGTDLSVEWKGLGEVEREKVRWQWWNDVRLRDWRYHYFEGDFVIHLAGCWVVEGSCQQSWKHFWDTRGSVKGKRPRRRIEPT